MTTRSLNEIYTRPSMERRYEVWFLKLKLADGSGALWLRYLLMNLGRDAGGCGSDNRNLPVQVWATWFPEDEAPQHYLHGFPTANLSMSDPGSQDFHLEFGQNRIFDSACAGTI